MSALSPGLYRATVADVADRVVFVDSTGWCYYARISDGKMLSTHSRETADARTLTVLDLENPGAVVRSLRAAGEGAVFPYLDQVAASIEAQSKPARISEPGLWGVVEAFATAGDTIRREWDHRRDGWWTPGYTVFPWDALVHPTLIRAGLDDGELSS